MEARVYAEDPLRNFLPSIGKLVTYKEPGKGDPQIRVDSGVLEGSDISIYYDPLICKLITWGDTRDFALSRMTQALDRYVIRGVTHNISLLRDIMTEKQFVEGDITTKYLFKTYPEGFKGKQLNADETHQLAALTAGVWLRRRQIAQSVAAPSSNTKLPISEGDVLEVVVSLRRDGKDEKIALSIKPEAGESVVVDFADGSTPLALALPQVLPSRLANATINSKPVTFQLIDAAFTGQLRVQYLGTIFHLDVKTKEAHDLVSHMPEKRASEAAGQIAAPMPGVIKAISVKVGQSVLQNQEICVLEAMKMQNSLIAPKAGKVKAINAKLGETVSEGFVLAELE